MAALRLAFRLTLLMVLGVASVVVGMFLASEPGWELALLLAVLLVTMLRVAGWWPKAIAAAWWKLDLPTDNPRIAGIGLGLTFAAYGLHHAWDVYTNPLHEFRRIEKTIVRLLGLDGVTAFWIAFACIFFAAAIDYYRKRP